MRKPTALRRRRGYLLTWVMALMAIMLTLIAALHHYEVVSRRVSDRALAELQFLQARRWELARMRKLVPDSWAPSLDVKASTRLLASGVEVPNDLGNQVFHQTNKLEYYYDGFPDLEVKRDAPSATPPPYYQRYASRLSSWVLSLSQKQVETVTTDLSNLAAYAPAGSVALDSVSSWSPPPLDAKRPYDKATGEEPWVVAGSDVRITNMPYGRVHTNPNAHIRIGSGMAMPSAGTFPQSGLENALCDAISQNSSGHLMYDLREAAEALDDKTHLVGDEPPWLWDADGEKILGFLSVRSSFSFKCYSVPCLATGPTGLKRIYVQAPFGPDLGTAATRDQLDMLNKELKEAAGRAKELFDRKLGYTIRLRFLKGGQRIPADQFSYQTEMPEVPGLLRGYLSLRRALENDDARLTAEESSGGNKFLTDLQTNQSLLVWLAQVGPNGFSNPQNPKPAIPFLVDAHASIPNFSHSSANAYPRAWLGPLLLNNLYDRLQMGEKGALDFAGTPLAENAALTPEMWESILLRAKDHPIDPARVTSGALTPLKLQHEFIRFLLNTADAQNPWAKTSKIVEQMETDSLATEASLVTSLQAIDMIKAKVNEQVKKTRPENIEADNDLAKVNPVFGAGKGLPGSAFLPYGVDVFLIVDFVRAFINKTLPDTWLPSNPMVYCGKKGNGAGLEFSSKGTTITANFTVPAGRMFHYADNLTIKGDLCLERGACMVVRGKLSLVNPQPGNLTAVPWFGNSGRIVMEPGSSLVVDGDLSAEGSRYTSSVLILTEGGRVDPLSCAILAKGNVNLPFGMGNGMTIPQLFGTMGQGKSASVAFYSWVFTEALPVFSKLPIGNPLLGYDPVKGWSWPGLGPFSPRRPYFAQFCPEWEFRPLTIWIPLTPIVFTIYLPWDVEATRDNLWNDAWKWAAPYYAGFDNLVLGENLSKHSAMYLDGMASLVLVVPKISPAQILPDGWRLPSPPSSELPDLAELMTKSSAQWLEQGQVAAQAMNALQSGRPVQISPLQAFPVPGFDWRQWFDFMLKLYLKVSNWTYFITPGVLADGIGCESSGCLVYGKNISIGLDDRSSPIIGQALLASGLFVAEKDININALHTLGCLVSRSGSINNMPGVHTELLANPQFTRIYANSPQGTLAGLEEKPKVGAGSNLFKWISLQQFVRLADIRYGPSLPKPKPQFIGVPAPLRLTQDGPSQ